MNSKSWYRSWFDSPYYHILYKKRDVDEAVNFIDRIFKYLAPSSDSTILDLACGKGRHSVYMNQKGYDVTGLDLSPENIKLAKANENKSLHFAVHDMRLTYAKEAFDYVMNLFTSFGYFDELEENKKVLQAVNHSLASKGVFVLDFLNANLVIADLVEDETKILDGVRFDISRRIEQGMIVKHIHIEDGTKHYDFQERVKALNRQDFIGMLNACDFEILDTFGNYNLDKYHEADSDRLIIIARKIG